MAEWAYIIPQESKAIVLIGFMPDGDGRGTLRVRFRSSEHIYQAERVPTAHFVGLCCTKNRGQYFERELRDNYEFVTVARVL